MINRIIIRIKVLLIVYAYYQNENKDLKSAENELMYGLSKSYDLYHYLLLLIPALTLREQKRIDKRKSKYLATEEDKNPNTRLANNRFAEQLRINKQLLTFFNEKGSIWTDEDTFLENLLDQILSSEFYTEYLDNPDNYDSDKYFWRRVFKNLIQIDSDLFDLLEDKNIYWNDDLIIIGSFVQKTLRCFDESTNPEQPLLPMFKDEEDRLFAIKLLRKTILESSSYIERIERHIKNWDIDRVACIDLYIIQIAMAELLNFPTIPVNVTLNEYIDIAKFYSTSKSSIFINGTLDAIVKELKTEEILFKN